MAVDIIARGIAAGLISGENGTIPESKLPLFHTENLTTYEVGGVAPGTNLNNLSFSQILNMMFYGAVTPVLTDPSFAVSMLQKNAVIGGSAVISGVAKFDRGSIAPAYGTSGYRAGEPYSYVINGNTIANSQVNYPFELNIANVLPGENTFSIVVNYNQGEQPLNNIGENYDTPYPAGSITENVIIYGVYPLLSNDSMGELQQLSPDTQVDPATGYVQITVVGESSASIKQKVAFPSTVDPIVGIQQLDTFRDIWDWIGGSPENSLGAFKVYNQSININGNDVDYVIYENALVQIGERKMRFFTKLPIEEGK